GIDELAEEAFDESGSEPQGNHPHTLTLREVYELAELFAKANDAENYRDAPGAWATAADSHPAVCADLGTALATRVTEALEALTTAGGRAMTPGLIPTVAWAGSTTTGMKLFLANRAVRKCAPDIQASARAVYERIE